MKTASDIEIYMLGLINAEREARGLKPLVLERNLNDSAERYSDLLLDEGHFSHTGPDGSSVRERIAASTFDMSKGWSIGENLAVGTLSGGGLRDDVDGLHKGLMESSGHRANILKDDFTHVGLGIEIGDFDPFSGRPTMMITQNFGASSGVLDAQIDGTSKNDSLYGGTGDDVLRGGAGDDRLYGKDGDDTLLGDSGDDYLSGADGDDRLYGDRGRDLLNGGDGDDRLRGGGGDDRLYGKDGDDTLLGDSGDDYLSGADGDDRLYGDRGRDLLNGGDGDDRLRGGHDDDKLYGKDGHDTLLGDSGDDYLSGADGDDKLYGGHGHDTLNGGRGDDRLAGGNGDDGLYGKDGDDVLLGEDGRDRLSGADGRDVLDGGDGDDWLAGGDGADMFVFSKGFGNDRITDFGAGDRIDLQDVARITEFDDLVRHHLSQQGGDAVIDDGQGNTIILDGIDQTLLSSDHFVF